MEKKQGLKKQIHATYVQIRFAGAGSGVQEFQVLTPFVQWNWKILLSQLITY